MATGADNAGIDETMPEPLSSNQGETVREELERQVKEFVADTRRVRIEKIRLDTTLFGNLGIDGDDADDFFTEFQDRFGVDLSSFDLSEHFGSEGWPLWALVLLPFVLLSFFFRKGTPEEKAGLKPITISALIDAAGSGRFVPEK